MNEYQKRIAKRAEEIKAADKELAKQRLAARRSELAAVKKAGKRDADLEVLIGEASAAYNRGAYMTAAGLLSDETLAYQRSLDGGRGHATEELLGGLRVGGRPDGQVRQGGARAQARARARAAHGAGGRPSLVAVARRRVARGLRPRAPGLRRQRGVVMAESAEQEIARLAREDEKRQAAEREAARAKAQAEAEAEDRRRGR